MKKMYWLIIGAALLIIFTTAAFFFSNETTATIPSKSSYAPTFKDWSIHFSEKMNPDTFTENTVQVVNNDGERVEVNFDWNSDYTVLTLRAPEKGYTLNQSYEIMVSDNVETAGGDQLDQDFSHSFTAVAELPNIKDKEQLVTLLTERMKQRRQMFAVSEDAAESSGAEGAMDTASSSNAQKASTTNVQVNGIDEGDIIKTDGKYVYFARESDVVITSADKKNSSVISTIEYEDFHPAEIYLHENLLVMIGHTSEPIREPRITDESDAAKQISLPVHSMQTTALIYDVSDRKNPEKVREVSFEGSLSSSRLMDGQLYLIANQHPPYHILREDADEKLKKTDLRPYVLDTVDGSKGRPLDFDSMFFFPESQDESFLLLASIDLENLKKRANIQAYLGASNQIYMSDNHLYIAVQKYDFKKRKDTFGGADIAIAMPPANTEISQFKINDGIITFNASTVVPGRLINQFAMDERDGIFRVATTKGNMWNDEEPSTNNLYTFDMQMNPVGSLEGLAEDERIYSVRFMEDVAYMVTFRQVDPLFVIDLKDPKNPNVLGKLKIPGFSNYLHPLDENHVIGFGQNTKLVESKHSEEPRVRMDGLKISVFDVSDPTKPVEKYSEIIGQGHSFSEINHNHNALYQHPEKNIFGFPATLFETKIVQQGDATFEDQKFVYEGAFLYNITPENGIKLKDTITHQENMKVDYPDWASQVKRMVSVGDTLYTFSLDQMNVYDLPSEKVIKTVDLPDLELKERF